MEKIYCSDQTWLEGDALEQFKRVLSFEGIEEGRCFPDIHPGKGIPVGAAFLSDDVIYPSLIGSDIGCGMTLFTTDVPIRKLKIDKLLRRLGDDPEDKIRSTSLACLPEIRNSESFHLEVFNSSDMLGTIGHGNHFIEIQSIEEVINEDCFKKLGILKDNALILVHCGSRGHGESLWNNFASEHGNEGVSYDSPDGRKYLETHAELINWARFNRRIVGEAIGRLLSCEVKEVCDSVHNSIKNYGDGKFIHRKGASEVESFDKPVMVAGSRGTFSYLVNPAIECLFSLWSISHGCGRKWNRQSTRARVREKHLDTSSLLRTELGTKVICPDKELLYEEAPEAYKNISDVVQDLQLFNLATPVVKLKPIVNIKP